MIVLGICLGAQLFWNTLGILYICTSGNIIIGIETPTWSEQQSQDTSWFKLTDSE